MDKVDDLIIYKQCLQMIYYTEKITKKYPKDEKFSLVSGIKNETYKCMKLIILAQKCYDKYKRINILNEMDASLKMLKVYIRVSYKEKYISIKNYEAWSRKITNICNLLGGWIISCQKK